MITGLIICYSYDIQLFTRGILLSLLWLAIAPFLIQDALRLIVDFFEIHKDKFRDKEEWHALLTEEITQLQKPSYLLFGIQWALVLSVLIVFAVYRDFPMTAQVWAFVSFFILFLLSAIGFRGIMIMITMIKRICQCNLHFDPYHPDRFGGFADFGRFSVKGSLFFSSGALHPSGIGGNCGSGKRELCRYCHHLHLYGNIYSDPYFRFYYSYS